MCIVCISTLTIATMITPANTVANLSFFENDTTVERSTKAKVQTQEFAKTVIRKAGKPCNKIGEKFPEKNGYLECRWIAGEKKVYFSLSNKLSDLKPIDSPEPYTSCRLPEAIKSRIDNWNSYLSIAYPAVKSSLNPVGTNSYLFIPIDFEDAVGTGSMNKEIDSEIKKINEWLKWYSNGKAKVQIEYPKKWVRSSYLADDLLTFRNPGNPGDSKGKLTDKRLIEALLVDVEELYDLNQYNGVYFLPSRSAKSLENGVFMNGTFKTPKGSFTGGGYVYANTAYEREEFPWAFIMHDFLHSFGLALHAPDQGLPFGIQSSPSGGLAINKWDSMSLDWVTDSEIYCVSKENLQPTEIELVPIEREQKGIQSIMIKLSDTKVLVIESHRRDKWGSKFQPGFYGVTTFLVDTSVQNDATKPDSESTRFANYIKNSSTRKGRIVERRFWEEIDKNGKRNFGWVTQPTWDLNYILFEKESLTTNGIRITLKRSGNNDLVAIQRV